MRLKKYRELYGVTDGKAIGTFVEHRFQDYLEKRYDMTLGSSALGPDLPSVNCDIKVTSLKQPQSSLSFQEQQAKDIWAWLQSDHIRLRQT